MAGAWPLKSASVDVLLQLLLNYQRVQPGKSAAFLAPLRGPKMWADIGSTALQQGALSQTHCDWYGVMLWCQSLTEDIYHRDENVGCPAPTIAMFAHSRPSKVDISHRLYHAPPSIHCIDTNIVVVARCCKSHVDCVRCCCCSNRPQGRFCQHPDGATRGDTVQRQLKRLAALSLPCDVLFGVPLDTRLV